jgi:subtilisin family serine protease
LSCLRIKSRHAAVGVALLLVAFGPLDAHAQLRGLSTPGPSLGGIGSLSPGGASIPRTPDLPARTPETDIRSPLPGSNVETPGGAVGRIPSTITNTLDGSVTNPNIGRLPAQIGDNLNRLGPNVPAGRNPPQQRLSRVPPPGEQRFIANEVLVGLQSNLSPQALDAIALRHRLARLDSQRIGLTGTTFHRWQILDRRSVADVVRALEADAGVSMAQPNYRFTLQQNDVRPGARDDDDVQYTLAKLRIPEAHRLSTGAKVRVAVIDNGIDISHPEIAGVIADSFDATNSTEPPARHGTAMAGVIVAHARLMGIAPAARILAIRAFSASGTGDESTTLTIVRSIDWAVAHEARIINMSFAGPQDPEIARSLAAASRKGVVLVAAAGNAGPKSGPLYPAADPNVIAVTAIDSDDQLFAMSNRGRHIALSAPGVDIIGPAPGNTYQVSTGTSVAAAHVSGVVALLLELRPSLKPPAVRQILTSTAKDLGPKGRDDQFGAGLADAHRAILSLTASSAGAPAKNASAAQ